MHLIIGGKYMGKLQYAHSLYGEDVSSCDLSVAEPEEIFGARIVTNLQEGTRHMLEKGESLRFFFESNMHRLEDKILIGDEIGSGIVPLDPFERLWRDETGFLYQALAARAHRVDRVWAGLPCRLK
ncbi:MAG: bifunctional adenosylcobinamide kinase/adenosylcobinamide-phosphate guanylyltransferase [Synergistaceae bacterium]|jgi:adenosyl cobinamide kinase/adenosyl cobinamide phosphate guanylyltransferase|nr:bifunctional adenosylcobinamide kinase/adenosylcobinamide-phosphate guanylyltransferase [Synergistaceae bacterium]